MLGLLFVVLVVVGFAAKCAGAFGWPPGERMAWSCWLIAAVIWGLGRGG